MAKVAKIIDNLTGSDEEILEQKEQFKFLQTMGETKCAQFKAELEKNALGEHKQIEIGGGRYIQYYQECHIDLHSGANDSIDEALKGFFKGKEGLKDGFHALISTAIDSLINETVMGETTRDMFFVYPENNAIVRLDVKAYVYRFTKKGLIADCENLFCYTMGKSIIDYNTLDISELLYFLSDMAGASDNIEVVKKFSEEIVDIIKSLQQFNITPAENVLRYQLDDLRSDIQKTRGTMQEVIQYKEGMTNNEIADSAKKYGWVVQNEGSDNIIMTKHTENTNNRIVLDNNEQTKKAAVELINLVATRDK